MPIETYAPAATTPSILDIFEEVNQTGRPGGNDVWFADGRESLAVSLEAASLQREWMEAARHLFFEPAGVIRVHAPSITNLFPVLLDVACFNPTIVEEIVDHGQEHLAVKLWASFEDNPLEDGMEHPAEGFIAEALQPAKDQRILDWLRDLCADASHPSFAASVLRCLGRHGQVGSASWRVGLVRDGLAMDSVEIRDAAAQAAESWGGSELLDVLRTHYEPEPWLRQYISDVIDDLAG